MAVRNYARISIWLYRLHVYKYIFVPLLHLVCCMSFVPTFLLVLFLFLCVGRRSDLTSPVSPLRQNQQNPSTNKAQISLPLLFLIDNGRRRGHCANKHLPSEIIWDPKMQLKFLNDSNKSPQKVGDVIWKSWSNLI